MKALISENMHEVFFTNDTNDFIIIVYYRKPSNFMFYHLVL